MSETEMAEEPLLVLSAEAQPPVSVVTAQRCLVPVYSVPANEFI